MMCCWISQKLYWTKKEPEGSDNLHDTHQGQINPKSTDAQENKTYI